MTPEAAIHEFLNGFGVPAYPSASVPDQSGPDWHGYPYITYDLTLGSWLQPEVNMPVNLYDRTTSEKALNDVVRDISRTVGIGGVTVPCDGGMLWIKKGSPWAQALTIDGEDESVKRRYINVNIEFLTIE